MTLTWRMPPAVRALTSSSLRDTARVALAPAIAGVLSLAPALARADESVIVRELDPKTGAAIKPEEKALTYLNVGPILSYVDAANTPPAYEIGLEASLNHYGAERIFAFGYGVFAQLQLVSGKYFHGDLGGQVNAGPVGLELGLGVRQGDDTYATTCSLHTALFLSAGYLFIAFRISPELFASSGGSPREGFGLETAFQIGLKLPIAVQGRDPTGLAIQAAGHAW
jgi:hypothetical protein